MPRWSQLIAILKESLHFAFNSLRVNLMRTLLSMLAIIIGIFTIISILTFIDSLDRSVRDSVSELGGDVIYVQKWPWIFESDYPWWKFINRPEIEHSDLIYLEKKLKKADAITMIAGIYGKSISFGGNQVKNTIIEAVSHDYQKVNDLKIENGRYFSEFESKSGSPKVIIGSNLATTLFGAANPIGKAIKLLNKKFIVIGVLEKKGKSNFAFGDIDNKAILPLTYVRYLYGSGMENLDVTIIIKGKEKVTIESLEDESRGVLRAVRRLKPGEEDNFALNRPSFINEKLNDIFRNLSLMGWIIAGFSILVGGFGTANIMFVSVKERTYLIGTQKALGAPRYFILAQFLGEAVILCLFGGIIGLLLVLLVIIGVNGVQDQVHLVLNAGNVFIGIGLSSAIGIVAGFIPSYQASRLDPIEAIRSNF